MNSSIKNTYQTGWLASFLQRRFFEACPVHKNLRNNKLRWYCIRCDRAACKYCTTSESHDDHKLLKIFRHVHQDVVRVADMETVIDCSRIQVLSLDKKSFSLDIECNRNLVIALQPLPHYGSGESNLELACDVCSRILHDPVQYRFCSIACKVAGSSSKNRRKGIPRSAPFK